MESREEMIEERDIVMYFGKMLISATMNWLQS